MFDVSTPRFVKARPPHYESFYMRAWDAAVPRSVWIRYTTSRSPGSETSGSLWVTAFEPDTVTAFRQDNVPATAGPGGRWIQLGSSSITEDPDRTIRIAGHASEGDLSATWGLAMRPTSDPWLHLAPELLYRAPIPKTKSTSPVVSAHVRGSVVVNGEERTYGSAMLGHNWGSEHAHRWIWIHASDDAGNAVDLVGGRLKVAGRVLPWRISGMVELDGVRRRIGGMCARADVDATHERCVFEVSGVKGEITAGSGVDWIYDDPSGRTHQVHNSSISTLRLRVDGRDLGFEAAAYELGVEAN